MTVVWFFQRAGSELRVVTRFDRSSEEYVVEIEWPDGERRTERFADVEAFDIRIRQLHMELVDGRWRQQGAPALLPDGWRGRMSRN